MPERYDKIELVTHSDEETKKAGEELTDILENGDLIVLTGPLGAGKTTFIKGIARGLGIGENDIRSPSFTLVNEYQGRFSLFHIDLYRLDDISELAGIGWDEYLTREGIVVVEWGEKAAGLLPRNYIRIGIEIVSETVRELNVAFLGR